MSERRLKTYEHILWYVLILAMILGIISSLTGCGEYFELDTKTVIDYRFSEAHTETWTRTTDKGVPYNEYHYVPDKYELLWEETYKDGHTERKWEECTRFEYQNAKEELGQ